ncbi:MAG: hypothetical protein MPJ50_00095 [Pirellulales bacterium]|nr:hypothetical protein [Pirellulales bacterium]
MSRHSRKSSPAAFSPVSHVPLLQIQRELCEIPRGRGRFDEYLKKMTGPQGDLTLPLSAFNPMAKDHVAARLDELLELDAEQIAQQAIDEANQRLGSLLHPRPLGLVMADDFGGGWTNRDQMEAESRFGKVTRIERDWLVVLCWSSEVPVIEQLRRETLAHIYRGQYRLNHGQPITLEQMLTQEGTAMRFAGMNTPSHSAEDIRAARYVIERHRSTADYPTAFSCLYGDQAAHSVGYTSLGIPSRGGFSVALAESLERKATPEELLRQAVA